MLDDREIMKTASVAELRAHLSAHLRSVQAGDEILVTQRGVPVARLVPLGGSAAREGRLSDLARAGLVRLPRGTLRDDFFDLPRPADEAERGIEAILEERAEGP